MVTLVKWHKRELDNIRKEMDHVFNRCFQGLPGVGMRPGEWAPCLDLLESRDELVVRAELPGMEAEDLKIAVHGKVLTLRGHKPREECSGEESYHCMERAYGSFSRSINLPCMVDPDRVEAVFKNGVLTITLPKWKSTPQTQRTISVK